MRAREDFNFGASFSEKRRKFGEERREDFLSQRGEAVPAERGKTELGNSLLFGNSVGNGELNKQWSCGG